MDAVAPEAKTAGDQINKSGQDAAAGAKQHGELCAPAVAQDAGELARQHRGQGLHADHNPDRKIVEAEDVVNLQRNGGKRHSHRQVSEKDDKNERRDAEQNAAPRLYRGC
jgi:hypothetical protein